MAEAAYTLNDLDVLARTLYGEARGEGAKGMVLVANVIITRSQDRRWPNSVADVCQQPWQFSCWNKNDPNLPKLLATDFSDKYFVQAYTEAAGVLYDRLIKKKDKNPVTGCNHYMTGSLYRGSRPPSWIIQDDGALIPPDFEHGCHVFFKL